VYQTRPTCNTKTEPRPLEQHEAIAPHSVSLAESANGVDDARALFFVTGRPLMIERGRIMRQQHDRKPAPLALHDATS